MLDTVAQAQRFISGSLRFTAGRFCLMGLLAVGAVLPACNEIDPEPQIAQLRSLQAGVREKAAGQLVLYGEPVVPRLIQETNSDYTRVRFEVARILGRIRDPRATDAMVRLLDDRSFNVAAYAAWGLGEMRAPEAVPTLLRFVHTPAKVFREQVVWALGRCYDDTVHADLRDSVTHVVERTLQDPTPSVRMAALQSARELGYVGMTDRLLRLSADPSAEVRHVAIQALGQVATGDTPRPGIPPTPAQHTAIVERLVQAIDEPYQSIRTKAVRALESMGRPPEAVPALQRLLREGTVEDQREARRVLDEPAGQAATRTDDRQLHG